MTSDEASKLSDDELRVRVAEIDGYREIRDTKRGLYGRQRAEDTRTSIPWYPNDLDATWRVLPKIKVDGLPVRVDISTDGSVYVFALKKDSTNIDPIADVTGNPERIARVLCEALVIANEQVKGA